MKFHRSNMKTERLVRKSLTRGVIKWTGEHGISKLASVIKPAIYSTQINLVRDAGVGDFHKSGRGSKNQHLSLSLSACCRGVTINYSGDGPVNFSTASGNFQ